LFYFLLYVLICLLSFIGEPDLAKLIKEEISGDATNSLTSFVNIFFHKAPHFFWDLVDRASAPQPRFVFSSIAER
jgi:hypothetical protein